MSFESKWLVDRVEIEVCGVLRVYRSWLARAERRVRLRKGIVLKSLSRCVLFSLGASQRVDLRVLLGRRGKLMFLMAAGVRR